MEYHDFIASKHFKPVSSGFPAKVENTYLRDYQIAIVEWALARGRSACFVDTGLGKTLIELEWAHQVATKTRKPVLIMAPLAVAGQIKREGAKFGYECSLVRDDGQSGSIQICNYDMMHKLDISIYAGVVLDESSILKGIQGKMRKQITEGFTNTPYRLSATATPAPNDFMEIGTQSEFLGIMTQVEMLATFFIHDGGDTSKWRLKGHGERKFFEWLATWAVIMRDPADYGFNPLPELPALIMNQHEVVSGITDGLFAAVAQSLSERLQARKSTIEARCKLAAEIAMSTNEPVLIWCGLNDEGDLVEKMIADAVQVAGSDKDIDKESRLLGFSDGIHRCLITKSKIAGFGMNWQHCNHMIFVGLSDSWEQLYQAIRRCWRQGQKRAVRVDVITADVEGAVVANIKRKQEQADKLSSKMAAIASQSFVDFRQASRDMAAYKPKQTAPKPSFGRKS
jgi:hypothetical protein